jgi:hypothetical protein
MKTDLAIAVVTKSEGIKKRGMSTKRTIRIVWVTFPVLIIFLKKPGLF